jgi:hypothetical protein
VDFDGPRADREASGDELRALASNNPGHHLTLPIAQQSHPFRQVGDPPPSKWSILMVWLSSLNEDGSDAEEETQT